MPTRIPQLMLVCLAATACVSCQGFWSRITGETARAEKVKAQETELQQQVMRFSDQFVERAGSALTAFQHAPGTTAETRLDVQVWKLKQATAAVEIASGQYALVDAVDMVVLVTLSSTVIEDTWIPRYGERARPVLEAYQAQEPLAWKLIEGQITPEQQTELREALKRWRASNPNVESVSFVRLADIARKGKRTTTGQTSGLFGLLGLDPLAGLDPAVREVEQSRLLAERTVFYAQRMPGLISAQGELLAYQFAVAPETRDLLSATTRVSEASRSIANTASTLPEWATRERQAAIDQFMQALQSQQETMRALLVELRQALEAGNQTSESLTTTVRAVDELVGRFKPGEAAAAPGAPKKPFDINDYTRAAAEFAATARQLEQLVASLNQNVPGVAAAAQRVTEGGRDLVDYAFGRALILVVVLIVGVLAAVLAYRVLAVRIARRTSITDR